MKHPLSPHVWKLKSKEILPSLASKAIERGVRMRVDGEMLQEDRVVFIFECSICGTEKVEVK